MNASKARLRALLAATLFSTGGAGIKVAAFSGSQVASLRGAIAAAALLILMRRQIAWSARAVAVGVLYAATTTTFVVATKLTTSANAIFLVSIAPLHVLLLGPLLLGEHFRRRDLLYLIASTVGLVFCVFGRPDASATAPDPARGNLLAVACSVMWALTLIALRGLERDRLSRGEGAATLVAGNVFAALLSLPFALPITVTDPLAWATIVYLGVFQIGLGYVCLTSAMRQLPALEVSLLLLLEPVLNPIWVWIVHAENPGKWVLVGGGIILTATTIKTIYDAQRTSPPPYRSTAERA